MREVDDDEATRTAKVLQKRLRTHQAASKLICDQYERRHSWYTDSRLALLLSPLASAVSLQRRISAQSTSVSKPLQLLLSRCNNARDAAAAAQAKAEDTQAANTWKALLENSALQQEVPKNMVKLQEEMHCSGRFAFILIIQTNKTQNWYPPNSVFQNEWLQGSPLPL